MSSGAGSAGKSGQESVVLASFDSHHHAEHMLASLGLGFRKQARKGGTTAVVVRGNPDGSLRVTKSRVLSAGDLASTLIHLSVSWAVGFIGLSSMLKGAKREAHAAHVHKRHAGSEKHRAHEILDAAGPNAALALVRCEDPETRQMVVAARPTLRTTAGMARCQSFSPPSTPEAPTIGYAPLSASPPARTTNRPSPVARTNVRIRSSAHSTIGACPIILGMSIDLVKRALRARCDGDLVLVAPTLADVNVRFVSVCGILGPWVRPRRLTASG